MSVDSCTHIVMIAFIILFGRIGAPFGFNRQNFLTSSCELLADAQKSNVRAFSIYLRNFIVWYFEEESCNHESIDLLNHFFNLAPDLMIRATCAEVTSVIIDAVVQRIMIGTSLITKLQIELILAKVLELVPLPLSIDIIAESFCASKNSRLRMAGISCIDSILCQVHFLRVDPHLSQEVSAPPPIQAHYKEQLEATVKSLKMRMLSDQTAFAADDGIESSRPIHRSVEITLSRGMGCLLDAGESRLTSTQT